MRNDEERTVPLYLILADPDFAGPGARRLVEILHANVGREYKAHRSVQA